MIFVEDTQVKIGSVTLPGLFKSMEVTGTAQIEEQEIEGSNAKKKQALGYEDARVNLELTLEDGVYETKYFKLQKLQNLFKRSGQEKPIVYDIVSDVTAIRNISKVVFKSLSSKEDNATSRITVTIELLQWDSMNITATVLEKPVGGVTEPKTTPVSTPPRASRSGHQRRSAPKTNTQKKEKKSPAKKDTTQVKSLIKSAKYARDFTRRK